MDKNADLFPKPAVSREILASQNIGSRVFRYTTRRGICQSICDYLHVRAIRPKSGHMAKSSIL